MNKVHALTAENLLAALPQALREDESVLALAAAAAEVLAARPAEIDGIRIYSRIDELTEEMLDILAYDFKVDWWDGNYTLAEKRRTLKDSWRVHRMLGTKAAVEAAISAIYPDTKVLEWWEYGGEPYHFKLEIDATYEGADAARHKRILDRVNYYKNLRSHLDGAEYIVNPPETAMAYAGAATLGSLMRFGVEVTPEGLVRPHSYVNAHAGASILGSLTRLGVELTVDGLVRPHSYVKAHAAGGVAGMRMETGAEVSFDSDIFRRGNVTMSAGVKAAGEYMEISTEVTANGLE